MVVGIWQITRESFHNMWRVQRGVHIHTTENSSPLLSMTSHPGFPTWSSTDCRQLTEICIVCDHDFKPRVVAVFFQEEETTARDVENE